MTRYRIRFVPLFLIFFFLISTASFAGETIIYTGDASMLRTSPGWLGSIPNSLYPSESSPSGNTVTVQFSTGTVPQLVIGGLDKTQEVSGNRENVIQGTMFNV